ncbi:hypothetical protein BKA65DRAFT_515178 [Rhexocercosporidium sp. MPI-PUGE-AT-0058]|nr:hypothetical protein BKA65DRAFT_515178 [Rhexocercosporidium sp. MPI-PUGE-AT-0058]
MTTKPLKPENVPIDLTSSPSPTHAFYIHQLANSTHITSLTSDLASVFSPKEGILIDAATNLITSTVTTPAFATKNENLLGTHFSVTNAIGYEVAEMICPLFSWNMGMTTIVIKSEDQGEMVEIKPIGFGRRAQVFERKGATYFWDVDPHRHEHKSLYKVIEFGEGVSKRVEVARYFQESSRAKTGVLVLDSIGVDTMVGILTICAVLAVRESFTK